MRMASTAMARNAWPASSAARTETCRTTPSSSVSMLTWPTAAAVRAISGSGKSQLGGRPRTGDSVNGAANRAGQGIVVFLGSGVGEKHVDRDGLGLSGCHRVYGASDHLARLSITR